MDTKTNVVGTVSSRFQIGKSGVTIRQGTSIPGSEIGTDGDLYLVKNGGSSDLLFRSGGAWQSVLNRLPLWTTITGDNVTNEFTINHSFGTRDVLVQVRENFGSYRDVEVAVSRPTTGSVVLTADDPIANGLEYRVCISLG